MNNFSTFCIHTNLNEQDFAKIVQEIKKDSDFELFDYDVEMKTISCSQIFYTKLERLSEKICTFMKENEMPSTMTCIFSDNYGVNTWIMSRDGVVDCVFEDLVRQKMQEIEKKNAWDICLEKIKDDIGVFDEKCGGTLIFAENLKEPCLCFENTSGSCYILYPGKKGEWTVGRVESFQTLAMNDEIYDPKTYPSFDAALDAFIASASYNQYTSLDEMRAGTDQTIKPV